MKQPKNFDLFSDKDKENWLCSQQCIENIAQEFDIKTTVTPSLKDFSIIASKLNPIHFNAWRVGHSGNAFNLCLVKYDITYNTAGPFGGSTHLDTHLYFFGHLNLKQDFGVGLIRPETIVDKIGELFESIDIDFKSHPNLSYRYFVAAENKYHFSKMLTSEFLDFIEIVSGLQIEFRNNQCLFRLTKAVDNIESINLCKIGVTLDKILNNI